MENMNKILQKAKQEKYCVPQFNINNLEWTKYILEQSNELKTPVILGVSEGAAKHMGGYNTVAAMVNALIKDLNITIQVALHLDHGTSFNSCKEALDAGFTSVMIDASTYTLEDNIRITKEVVGYAKTKNASVEAEIGAIGGEEDGIVSDIKFAKTEEAIKLVKETYIDALAPALGSAHGIYVGEPNLNFTRMLEIKNGTNVPLVLHGGTGIPDEQIREAIKNGTTKLNINTELQLVWNESMRDFIKNDKKTYDIRKIIKSGEQAMKKTITQKVELLGSKNKSEVV